MNFCTRFVPFLNKIGEKKLPWLRVRAKKGFASSFLFYRSNQDEEVTEKEGKEKYLTTKEKTYTMYPNCKNVYN